MFMGNFFYICIIFMLAEHQVFFTYRDYWCVLYCPRFAYFPFCLFFLEFSVFSDDQGAAGIMHFAMFRFLYFLGVKPFSGLGR